MIHSAVSDVQTRRRPGFFRTVVPLFALCLGGCSAEMGRTITDTDVSCLRKQMGTEIHQSFPLAANTCQRWTNHNMIFGQKTAKPIPLNLKDAPDLQALAQDNGYSYTR